MTFCLIRDLHPDDMTYKAQVLEDWIGPTPTPEILSIRSFGLFNVFYLLRNDSQIIMCYEIKLKPKINILKICIHTVHYLTVQFRYNGLVLKHPAVV